VTAPTEGLSNGVNKMWYVSGLAGTQSAEFCMQ